MTARYLGEVRFEKGDSTYAETLVMSDSPHGPPYGPYFEEPTHVAIFAVVMVALLAAGFSFVLLRKKRRHN